MAVALCNASYDSARLTFLRAVCAVTEGIAAVTASPTVTAAALRDPRVCVLGGREGLPRSLGSVYAGSITRFLGGLRGVAVRRIFNRWDLAIETIAVSHDGAKAEFIGKLKIRFRFPAILTQFSVWGQACKLCLKMRFPQNQHF